MDILPIRSEADYDAAVKEIEPYFENEPEPGTPEADRFDVLSADRRLRGPALADRGARCGQRYPRGHGDQGLWPIRSGCLARLALARLRDPQSEARVDLGAGPHPAQRVARSERQPARGLSPLCGRQPRWLLLDNPAGEHRVIPNRLQQALRGIGLSRRRVLTDRR